MPEVLLQYVFDADCENCDAEGVDCIYLDSEVKRSTTSGGVSLCICLRCLEQRGQEGKGFILDDGLRRVK